MTKPIWASQFVWGLSLGLVGTIALTDVAWANSARLIIQNGSVSIKRAGWSHFVRVSNGSYVSGSDLIRLSSRAMAWLQCPNGQTVPLTPNIVVTVNSKCSPRRSRGISF